MKIKFKINKEQSQIKEWIKVPKTLIEAKPWKGKLTNFVEKKYLNKTYTFDYDEKKKILKSTDNHPKFIHGIYSDLNLKKIKKTKDGFYQYAWFTGFEGRFIKHDFLFRHAVTFDPLKNNYTLVNKIGYFFRKDGEDDFLPYDEDCVYIWMDYIKK